MPKILVPVEGSIIIIDTDICYMYTVLLKMYSDKSFDILSLKFTYFVEKLNWDSKLQIKIN